MLRLTLCTAIITVSIAAAVLASDRTEYGGWLGLTDRATGFFQVKEIDGRWWCFDPTGAAFFAIGTDHVNYNVHNCEALGYAPYARNVRAKFNNDESAWAKSSTDRLKSWYFNSLGANNSPSTRGRGLAYMGFLGMGMDYSSRDSIVERVHWTGFPNVFNPEFAKFCEEKAQAQCAPLKDDPWLFGWFIDNELEWYGKNGRETGIADEAIRRDADHHAKKALIELLKTTHSSIDSLNAAWGTSFDSWDTAQSSTEWKELSTLEVAADKREFVRLCTELYFRITTEAIRKADPNHMIIGCRFAGNAPGVWDIVGKYCDIVSLNYYGHVDLENLVPINLVEDLTRFQSEVGRPFMMTEWSFPALDAGLPSRNGAGQRVRTQADKAKCFEVYQKTFFSLPFVVGSNYFMWVDEPELGIAGTFPEDSNYGLVDVNDDPWKVFTETVARVNERVYDIRSGNTSEIAVTGFKVIDSPAGGDMRQIVFDLENTGSVPARVPLNVRVNGRPHRRTVNVPPNGKASSTIVQMLPTGAHYIDVAADPRGTLAEVRLGDNRLSGLVYVKGEYPGNASSVVGVYRAAAGVYPVSIPISKSATSPSWKKTVRVLDAQGREVKADLFDLEGSDSRTPRYVLSFQADLQGGKASTFFLEADPASGGATVITPSEVNSLDLDNGIISLAKSPEDPAGPPNGPVIDSIKLGDLEMGTFELMIQQTSGRTWWERSDRVERILLWDGSVCKRFEITARQDPPDNPSEGPFTYRTVYGFELPMGTRWFSSWFLSLTNTDSRPWTAASYYYRPRSADYTKSFDALTGMTGTGAWVNTETGACYGMIAPVSTGVQVYHWKDGTGYEHPDAQRRIGKLMKPGDRYAEVGDPIYVFCTTTKGNPEPWTEIEDEIADRPKWEIFPLKR